MSDYKPLVYKQPFSAELLNILHRVNQPIFTQKDTPFSPRMLNYYDQKHLLPFSSEKGKMRHFTGVQLFWLHILFETAKLGYAYIENLQDIKYLYENKDVVDGHYNKFNFFQYTLSFIIHREMEHHLKINEDAGHTFFTYHNLERIVQGDFVSEASHVDIALGPIASNIWKLLSGKELVFKKPSFPKTSVSSQELLARLEKNDFERIEIINKAGGTREINIIERNADPFTYDLHKEMSLMKNGKITISYGDKAGKALSIIKEKRIRAQDKN